MSKFWAGKNFLALMVATTGSVMASEPKPWQIGFQPSASPIMENITAMHNLLLIVIAVIGMFVTILLGIVLWRFRESKNPVPSKFSHHTLLEVVWTLTPVLILIMIGIPSLKLMFFADTIKDAEVTVKVVGHQWYWSYEYPDSKVAFESRMIPSSELQAGQLRLLAVDHPIVVPAGKVVRVVITSEDVLHSFAVPALGIKKDAVPGRLNETWFQIATPGMYYGQCSELCGADHGFMPIAVKAVPQVEYDTWIQSKKG